MQNRKSLSDILHGSSPDSLRQSWDETEAAQDFAPLPTGEYECYLHAAEFFESTKGTPGVKISFKVIDGEYKDRLCWHDCWLTASAMAMAKRDLLKLGVKSLEQLDRPLPCGIRCKLKIALRRDDDGTERNRVRSFEVVGIDKIEPDPFAPSDDAPEGGGE